MNRVIQEIPHYLSKKIADLAAADPEVINLSIGEPFFGPPGQVEKRFAAFIQEQISRGILPNKYAPSRGEPSLRLAIADRYHRLYQLKPNPETEVLVTHGAAEAIWLSVLCLSEIGDEILIPDPSYMLYETVVRLLNRVPVRIPTRVENGFVLDPEDVKAAINDRTRILFINSPENPTGAVYSREVFRALGTMAEMNGFVIVHDEVYDGFVFGQPHYNLLCEASWPPYLVLINSFSKRYAMMGWRLGWMTAAEPVISAALKVHTNLTLNLGSFHQEVAGTLLNDSEVEQDTITHAGQIGRQLTILYEALEAREEFHIAMQPKGGFFLFPDVRPYYQMLSRKWQQKYPTPGEVVATHLFEKHKIAVVPGYVYGPAGANHVRVVGAVAAIDIERACERLQNQPFTQ